GRDQIRQESVALVLVKTGRDELVNLRGDDRKRNEARAEQRQLQLGDEIFQERSVDEFRILGAGHPDERPYQHVVDLLREEEAEDKGDAKADQRLDQARAQLDQMVDQRRLAGFDIFVAHDALASRGSSTSADDCAISCAAPSCLFSGAIASGGGAVASA